MTTYQLFTAFTLLVGLTAGIIIGHAWTIRRVIVGRVTVGRDAKRPG